MGLLDWMEKKSNKWHRESWKEALEQQGFNVSEPVFNSREFELWAYSVGMATGFKSTKQSLENELRRPGSRAAIQDTLDRIDESVLNLLSR